MQIIKAAPSASDIHGALDILTALVKGLNPLTGARLPKDSIVHNTEVMRALLDGKEALSKVAARALRRALLPKRVGTSWTSEEDELLRQRFKEGATPEALATQHERSLRAIQLRLEALGVVPKRSGDASKEPIFGTRRGSNGEGAHKEARRNGGAGKAMTRARSS